MSRPGAGGYLLACPDKFKGTASALGISKAIADAARHRDFDVVARPLSDGGEGLLEVAGGANRKSSVTGPLGEPVEASWRLHDGEAVIEMAHAAGLGLAGGAAGNEPLRATTYGVGELIAAAVSEGAERVVVGCGGSATTDGGQGALEAIESLGGLRGARLLVACDVVTPFVEAGSAFGPQKGASPEQVAALSLRLVELRGRYKHRYGCDVNAVAGSGAAGGLAGALYAIGGRLVPGLDLVADMTGLDKLIAGARLVVTGEGHLDAGSFAGKVVGGVVARSSGREVVCIAGQSDAEGRRLAVEAGVAVLDLSDMFGLEAAMTQTEALTRHALAAWLGDRALTQ